jgi:hypothetical protein
MKQLDDQHRRTLYHIGVNRIGTRQTIAQNVFGSSDDQALAATDKVINQLKGSYLQVYPLCGTEKYCGLTNMGTRIIGFHEEAARPLGAQALSKHYAILHFTGLRTPVFRRQNRFTIQADFPELLDDLLPNRKAFYTDYYLGQRKQEPWLGRIQVDLGGGTPRFVVSCAETIADMQSRPKLKEAIDCGLVRFTIVTGDQKKKESIEHALKAKPLELPYYIHVAPELLNLIGQQRPKPRLQKPDREPAAQQLSLEKSNAS